MNQKTRRALLGIVAFLAAIFVVFSLVRGCVSSSSSTPAASTPPAATAPSSSSSASPASAVTHEVTTGDPATFDAGTVVQFGTNPNNPNYNVGAWKGPAEFTIPDGLVTQVIYAVPDSDLNGFVWLLTVGFAAAFFFFLAFYKGWIKGKKAGDWSRKLAIVCITLVGFTVLARLLMVANFNVAEWQQIPVLIASAPAAVVVLFMFFLIPAGHSSAWVKNPPILGVMLAIWYSLWGVMNYSHTQVQMFFFEKTQTHHIDTSGLVWGVKPEHCKGFNPMLVGIPVSLVDGEGIQCKLGAGDRLVHKAHTGYPLGLDGTRVWIRVDANVYEQELIQCIRPEFSWLQPLVGMEYHESLGVVTETCLSRMRINVENRSTVGSEVQNNTDDNPYLVGEIVEIKSDTTVLCDSKDSLCARVQGDVVRFAICSHLGMQGHAFYLEANGEKGAVMNVTPLPFFRPRQVPSGALVSLTAGGKHFDYVMGGDEVSSEQLGNACPEGTVARIKGASEEAAKLNTAAPQFWR